MYIYAITYIYINIHVKTLYIHIFIYTISIMFRGGRGEQREQGEEKRKPERILIHSSSDIP